MQGKKSNPEDKNWGHFTMSQKLILWDETTKKFLLVKEPDSTFFKEHPEYDAWVLLGGHMEESETVDEALRREVTEEAGDIRYDVVGPVFVGRSSFGHPGLFAVHLGIYRDGDITLSDEHTEYVWRSGDEIVNDEKIYPLLHESFKAALVRLKEREYLTDLQRLQADFENYKKRNAAQQKELAGYLTEKLVMDIVPVMDNFRSATEHVPEAERSSPWVTGIQYIEKQLEKVLTENGVETIATNVGDDFDPTIHEAIGTDDARDKTQDAEENSSDPSHQLPVTNHHIAKVIQNGYRIGERVIRPAKVTVTSG